MSQNMNMPESMNVSEHVDIPESEEIERKQGAIRTALFLLASSLILPLLHYLSQG